MRGAIRKRVRPFAIFDVETRGRVERVVVRPAGNAGYTEEKKSASVPGRRLSQLEAVLQVLRRLAP